MNTENDLGAFCRLIRARSDEHRRAMQLISAEKLYGQMAAILRQELDSMVRVIFLLAQTDNAYRSRLIGISLRGQRWRRADGNAPISDREMVKLAQKLEGWTASVYKFGCAFIHLSPMHDYATVDPLRALDAVERATILQYLRSYHGEPQLEDVGFDDIAPLLPNVFEKIANNLECYIEQLARGEQLRLR